MTPRKALLEATKHMSDLCDRLETAEDKMEKLIEMNALLIEKLIETEATVTMYKAKTSKLRKTIGELLNKGDDEEYYGASFGMDY